MPRLVWLYPLVTLALGFGNACQTPMSVTPRREINAVLADHDAELMALPGVVGVYVGLQNDGRTTCLKVMITRDDPALRRAIPRTIDGYRVIPEVTGSIKPMRQ
jgi:hypothetical protein